MTRGYITEFGAVFHTISGTDAQKMEHLRSHASSDLARAQRFRIPKHFAVVDPRNGAKWESVLPYEGFLQLVTAKRHLPVFEEAFASLRAPRGPLTCISFVMNGRLMTEQVLYT